MQEMIGISLASDRQERVGISLDTHRGISLDTNRQERIGIFLDTDMQEGKGSILTDK
jgi:hypothetical protein